MQYDLVFYPNKDEKKYVLIKGFDRDTNLNGIVEFCHKFENYNDLVNSLYEYGFISLPTLNGIFKIHFRTSKENNPKVFAKGLTYKNDTKFYDISYLQNYYAKNVNNLEFMKPIIDTHFNYLLSKSSKAQEHLYIIRFALNTKSKYGTVYESRNEINLESAIRNFVRSFCERKDSKNRLVTNFPNLMLLARIAIAHERQVLGIDPNEPVDDSLNINEEIKSLKQLIFHYSSLVNNGNITQDEINAYQIRIEDAKNRIEELTKQVTRR